MSHIVTTALLEEMERAFSEGESTSSIAERTGLGRTLVHIYRKSMGFDYGPPGRPLKLYHFINAETGETAAYGTLEECAEDLDTSTGYVKQMLTRARKGTLTRFNVEFE